MSPTLLELAVAIILIVVAWQIGIAIAPAIIRGLRSLKDEVDEAAEEVVLEHDQNRPNQHKEERTNGTRH
jgi:hypothetical protein